MPKYPSCTGSPAYGTPMQVSFTYPALDETTGLSTELPTSEPASAQISYTAGASHLPTTNIPISYLVNFFLWITCRNLSGSTRTISLRLEKNGTSIYTTTSSNVANNGYGACSLYAGGLSTTAPVVGDTFTVKLWSSGSGVQLQQHAFMLSPCAIMRGGIPCLCMLAGYNATPIVRESTAVRPTGGIASAYGYHYYTVGTGTSSWISGDANTEGTCGLSVGYAHPTNGIFNTDYSFASASSYFATAALLFRTEKRVTVLNCLPLRIKI